MRNGYEKISLYDLSECEGAFIQSLYDLNLFFSHDDESSLSLWDHVECIIKALKRFRLMSEKDYWKW